MFVFLLIHYSLTTLQRGIEREKKGWGGGGQTVSTAVHYV